MDDDQPPAFDQVPQRDEKRQAERVTDLGGGGNESDRRITGKLGLDHAEHGLVVVDVGHGEAGGDGHHQGGSATDGGKGRSDGVRHVS